MDNIWKKISLPSMGVLAPTLQPPIGSWTSKTYAVVFEKGNVSPHINSQERISHLPKCSTEAEWCNILRKKNQVSSSLEYCIESNTLEFNFAAKDGGLSSWPLYFTSPLSPYSNLLIVFRSPKSIWILSRLSGSIWQLNGEFEKKNKYSDNLDSRLELNKRVFVEKTTNTPLSPLPRPPGNIWWLNEGQE